MKLPDLPVVIDALEQLALCLTEERFDGAPSTVTTSARRVLLAMSRLPGEGAVTDRGALARSVAEALPPSWGVAVHDALEQLPRAAVSALGGVRRTLLAPSALYELLLGLELVHDGDTAWRVVDGQQRRASGSHYTPPELAAGVVERTLAPLLQAGVPPLRLRICDPAMGAGVFLVAAALYLGEQLCRREPGTTRAQGLSAVVRHCLFGVDRDPTAVLLTRLALFEVAGVEPGATLLTANTVLHERIDDEEPIDVSRDFAAAFERPERGFDAIVGNPPWVAYVGRATQPLTAVMRRHHLQHYLSFRRYRTLHGIFTERCAQLLRQGGRLGLVLPTSMADLAGYEPTRRAHDVSCLVDEDLPDLGDGQFADVFQPSMMLLSTRRAPGDTTRRPWRLTNGRADPLAVNLLQRLDALPKCPPELFGERGYQTTRADRERLGRRQEPGYVGLRTGTEVLEFQTLPPRFFANPSALSQRLRPEAQWRQVRVLIRQTARYPIASPSDGLPFRNSILAGFETAGVPWPLLLAYLNSTLVRWFHYQLHRDARQGMPQLKVGHLRALPRPPHAAAPLGEGLFHAGKALSTRGQPLTTLERQELDAWVNQAFELSDAERQLLEVWRLEHPPPLPRSAKPRSGDAACTQRPRAVEDTVRDSPARTD